ncbi:MAG: STAS domain-containing protein [Kiritimatiellae bacterium]|nr:STAS domain-containing protein [Kiritimatiellia bacterium]
MNITKKLDETKLTVTVDGNIDTVTAPQLDSELKLDGVTDLTFDISGVVYVSSAGLRVFLSAYKTMTAKKGTMTIKGTQPAVLDVFKITGFSTIFNLA